VATVFALLAGLGAVPLVHWYAEGRFVRHTTAEALDTALNTSPDRLDRYQWGTPAEPFRLLVGPVVAGRHVILTQGKGVRALDAVTGRPQWSYQRDDVRRNDDLAGVATVLGGRIIVLSYHFYGGALVVALDAAHGNELWQRRLRLNPGSGMPRLVADHDVVLLDATYLGGELVALDGFDGTPLWRWDTERRENPCETAGTSLAVAGSVAALVVSCHGRPDADLVIALSVADGRQRWTWRPPARTAGLKLPIRAADDRFWVTYAQTSEAALLDADTGAMTAAHTIPAGDPEPYRLPLISDGVLVYADEPAVGVDLTTGEVRWRLRTAELAGWQPIDAVSHNGTAYLLLAPAGRARSALTLLAIDIATGRVRDRQSYDPGRCGAECFFDADARILMGPGRLVVGAREKGGFWLRGIG
jgi:outer membrane protein assembly factor BamB